MDRLEQAIFAMLLYFLSLLILGAAWWKAGAIGVVLLTACILNFGARWITRAALLLFVYASALWVDLLPAREWRTLMAQQLAGGLANSCSLHASLFGSDGRMRERGSEKSLGDP